jgi:glycosyltransferase involved in cell wall biosynthesis
MPEHACFLIPGDPDQLTGGYLYNSRVIDGLRARGWTVDRVTLPGDTWPVVSAELRQACGEILEGLPDGAAVVIDGLAISGLLPHLPALVQRARVMILVHCPLVRETGISPALQQRFLEEEREALALAHKVVVTSAWTAGDVRELFGVPDEKLAVARPGVERRPLADGSGGVRLLCVGSLIRRKGQLELLEALTRIRDLTWTLRMVGSPDRDPGYAALLRSRIARRGLDARITLTGELSGDPLEAEFRAADVFVLPTWYETYGMALLEAVSYGLPVVTCSGGAVPSTVPAAARILVEPGDIEGLAEALRAVLTDDDLREGLAAAAVDHRDRLPTWEGAARIFERQLRWLLEGG